MQKFQLIIFLLLVFLLTAWFGLFGLKEIGETKPEVNNQTSPTEEGYTILSTDLEIPWDLAFLPNGSILVTERPGTVLHLDSGRRYEINGVEHVGEGGLLGIALHPGFVENNFIYLYQTTRADGSLRNRVVRYIYDNDSFVFDRTILDNIPGAQNHDGGRIEFGPDGLLYITVGDAGNERTAQDKQSLAGSILRVKDDGTIPPDNPFANAIYSYGHRNPQGLAWDDDGRLWSTEHGRSGTASGYDELNLIEKGANYGWPDSEGNEVAAGTQGPAWHSGKEQTWAPASAVFYRGRLFFGGLRGEALYEAVLDGNRVTGLKEHYKNVFGRIRTVRVGPDGYFYLTTSNRDGRGQAGEQDDKIIRLDPRLFDE